MHIVYTVETYEAAERIALDLNAATPTRAFEHYMPEQLAPGHWRVARVFRRTPASPWERESVPLNGLATPSK